MRRCAHGHKVQGRALAQGSRLYDHPALVIFFLKGLTMSKQVNWYYFRKG